MFESTFHIFISSNTLQAVLCYFWHERMRFLKIPEMMIEWSLKTIKTLSTPTACTPTWLSKQTFMTCILGYMLKQKLTSLKLR